MGVSSTARLPTLGAQSIPQLFNHLQVSSSAKVASRWSITIRSFRAVPVPTNAWPTDQDVASNSNTGASSSSASGSGPPPLTKPRTMWQVWISDYPGVVFVIVEDAGKPSRAKVWRDWEIQRKQWKADKKQQLQRKKEREEALRVKAEAEAQESARRAQETTNFKQAEDEKANRAEAVTSATEASATGEASNSSAMDVDPPPTQPGVDSKQEATYSEAQSEVNVGSEEHDFAEARPEPVLRIPWHTRFSVAAVTSSMSSMLTSLNLPPPHGAPVGTAGPGAWVPRGAAVSIEGLVLEINSQNLGVTGGLVGASPASQDDSGPTNVDWRVRVGSVVGGGGRSAGAVVEAEFLPLSGLLPTSAYIQDFLMSLFPPNLVNVPAPNAGFQMGMNGQPAFPGMMPMTTNGMSQVGATNPNMMMMMQQQQQGQFSNMYTNGVRASNASGQANGAGGITSLQPSVNYIIGPSTKLAGNTPNSQFNIPVISDQLWEEVVPRSGDRWCERILARRRKMKAQARASTTTKKDKTKETTKSGTKRSSAFEWTSFGSDDEEEDATSARNGALGDDEELSSDEEVVNMPKDAGVDVGSTSAAGLPGTTVTMHQMDEDDDDDDDRPLGATLFTNSNRNQNQTQAATLNSQSTATASAQPKKEELIQLNFQGLRGDLLRDAQEGEGWSGIERGRRIAFHYVQMLRAESII